MPRFDALTLTSTGGLLNVLISDCEACAAFDPASVPTNQRPPLEPFKALWDTGATNSVVSQDVITKCALKPTGMKQVHGIQGFELAETFLINIVLPNKVTFFNVEVTRGKLLGAHVLIGMDIITTGDLSITNLGQRTVFSFRVPSIAVVDFVKQANAPSFQHGSKHKHKKRPAKQFGKNKRR